MIRTLDKLQELISKGESDTLEFKVSFGIEVKETAGAFSNHRGGNIFIGVNNQGSVLGTTITHETLANWANEISTISEPTIIPTIDDFEVNGKVVVVITIKEFPLKPVAIRGRCYRRVGASNRVMTPAEISEMHNQSIGSSWDTLPHPTKQQKDIDIRLVGEYSKRATDTGRRNFKSNTDPIQLLKKLELITEDKPTWASIIAFGTNPPIQAKVKCGKIRGTATIVDDFVVDVPLLNQLDEVMGYFKRALQLSYSFDGSAKRKETWEYPLEALREAVTNAICHRDYGSNSEIQIKIFDDRLTIWNPGMLPFNVTIEDLYDPDHLSEPRNKLLAMIFYDVGLIERYGSGIQKILKECKAGGYPAPKFHIKQGGFQVVFYKDIYSEEYLRKQRLNDRQIKAVGYAKEYGKISISDYAKITQDVTEKTLQRDLIDLTMKGFFIAKGDKKGRVYEIIKN